MPRILPVSILALSLAGCPFFTSEDTSEPRGARPIVVAAVVDAPTPQPLPTKAPVPAPTPPPTRPAQPGGETVSARHILVQYQGSTRAAPTIERTKEQAFARAEEALAKARAGESFEDLARDYSDGPTSARGGDLGAFTRGRMHPAFEQASFALGVDEVSAVVETPFGYHIILRYQ